MIEGAAPPPPEQESDRLASDIIQGFYFAKPMTAESIPEYIDGASKTSPTPEAEITPLFVLRAKGGFASQPLHLGMNSGVGLHGSEYERAGGTSLQTSQLPSNIVSSHNR